MAMGYNKSKFRFSETFNNSNGKTSGSAFIGIFMGLTSIISFAVLMVGWWIGKLYVLEMSEKVLQFALLSAALLGVRKFSGAIMGSKGAGKVETDSEENKDEQEKDNP